MNFQSLVTLFCLSLVGAAPTNSPTPYLKLKVYMPLDSSFTNDFAKQLLAQNNIL